LNWLAKKAHSTREPGHPGQQPIRHSGILSGVGADLSPGVCDHGIKELYRVYVSQSVDCEY
jgi:hypothetical protein